MDSSVDILAVLRAHSDDLCRRFGVRRLGVFGSVARQDASALSDVDVLVEFATPSFDSYMDLKFALEDLFERKVDLVMIDTLKPALRDAVLAEARYVA